LSVKPNSIVVANPLHLSTRAESIPAAARGAIAAACGAAVACGAAAACGAAVACGAAASRRRGDWFFGFRNLFGIGRDARDFATVWAAMRAGELARGRSEVSGFASIANVVIEEAMTGLGLAASADEPLPASAADAEIRGR
jgi:hypothetical protein